MDKLTVQAYRPDLIGIVRDLHESQQYPNMHLVTNEVLPRIGYVVFQDEMPVASGFLRLMEGGFGLIDSYATNAKLSSDIRHLGLEIITNNIIEISKGLKLNGIFAFTADKGIISRAEATGFQQVNQSVYVLPLKEF